MHIDLAIQLSNAAHRIKLDVAIIKVSKNPRDETVMLQMDDPIADFPMLLVAAADLIHVLKSIGKVSDPHRFEYITNANGKQFVK